MEQPDEKRERVVRDYHERSKHRPDRFAASLGYMDWANQPDPFRTFESAQGIDLSLPEARDRPGYDDLYAQPPEPARLDAGLVSRLFLHSLALSAWKQAQGVRPWSLRVNPSSGDLHPTESYLVSGAVPGLSDHPGVFHYAPYRHRLERRCQLSAAQWQALAGPFPSPCLLIGLTSIYWREAWKYGERAFRYCHHDVGHAIAAVAFAARSLGWEVRLLDGIADAALARLLGVHLQEGVEAEHPDCLLLLCPAGLKPAGRWVAQVPELTFIGTPNRLSREHRDWPVIDEVTEATRNEGSPRGMASADPSKATDALRSLIPARGVPAERIIRQRRSAVAMDARSSLDRATFYQVLGRTLWSEFPFAVLTWRPYVSLAVFVHRVDELEPGLYLLARDSRHDADLRRALNAEFEWEKPPGCPPGLPFYRLARGDAGNAARLISCDQAIAADGAFALAMLADFDTALEAGGAAFYPRLYWECGMIGQLLYLEAEAAGLRATGIGCFFDDLMHELLGLTDQGWQSLYHFTVGGPVDDPRLKTIEPYRHLMHGGRERDPSRRDPD